MKPTMKEIAGALLPGISWFAEQKVSSMALPAFPAPQKEHEWLGQLTGEWDAEVEMHMEPGKPPATTTGTQTSRMIGGFWYLEENQGSFMGQPFTGILSIGFDPSREKYVGTWLDSMSCYPMQYTGILDKSGRRLVLEAEGRCPDNPGELRKFRDTIEIQDAGHKSFTSCIQEADESWSTVMVVRYRRRA